MTKKRLKIGAIILSRYDSSRLPGKALKQLGPKPLIQWPLDTLLEIEGLKPVIATSNRLIDQPIVEFAHSKGISCFKGDLQNVAKRTLDCSEHYEFDYFFRINGDSPFVNKSILKQACHIIEDKNIDFVTNLIERSYPYGLSCELIKTSTFKHFYPQFSDFQKEHITNFYYNNLKEVTFVALPKLTTDYSSIDWAIDTPEDMLRISQFLENSSIKNISDQDIEELIINYKTHLNI